MEEWFNWQYDIIGERSPQGYRPDGRPTYFYCSVNSRRWWWDEHEIVSALERLPDHELKACLLHQPVLAELIAEILMDTKRSK